MPGPSKKLLPGYLKKWYRRDVFDEYSDPISGTGIIGVKNLTPRRGKIEVYRKDGNQKKFSFGDFLHQEDAIRVLNFVTKHDIWTKDELVEKIKSLGLVDDGSDDAEDDKEEDYLVGEEDSDDDADDDKDEEEDSDDDADDDEDEEEDSDDDDGPVSKKRKIQPGDLTLIEMRVYGQSYENKAAMARVEKLEKDFAISKPKKTIKQRILKIQKEASKLL